MTRVEVAYATPQIQRILVVESEAALTIMQAIQKSGILDEFPEIDLNVCPVGIFSKKKELDHLLREGDRVEIYRPLICDPKVARRKRAVR